MRKKTVVLIKFARNGYDFVYTPGCVEVNDAYCWFFVVVVFILTYGLWYYA